MTGPITVPRRHHQLQRLPVTITSSISDRAACNISNGQSTNVSAPHNRTGGVLHDRHVTAQHNVDVKSSRRRKCSGFSYTNIDPDP